MARNYCTTKHLQRDSLGKKDEEEEKRTRTKNLQSRLSSSDDSLRTRTHYVAGNSSCPLWDFVTDVDRQARVEKEEVGVGVAIS